MSIYSLSMKAQAIEEWNLNHSSKMSKLFEAKDKLHDVNSKAPSWEHLEKPYHTVDVLLEQAKWEATQGEALQRALTQANKLLDAKIVNTAASEWTKYFDQVKALFDAEAKNFATASEMLPTKISADTLANFTEEEFKAYSNLKESAGVMRFCMNFISEAANIINLGRLGEFRSIFLLASPNDAEAVNKMQFATDTNDRVGLAVFPELRAALEAGAELRLATPADVREELAGLV